LISNVDGFLTRLFFRGILFGCLKKLIRKFENSPEHSKRIQKLNKKPVLKFSKKKSQNKQKNEVFFDHIFFLANI
jgi:hypothetical protein